MVLCRSSIWRMLLAGCSPAVVTGRIYCAYR